MMNPLPPENADLDARLMTVVADFRHVCASLGVRDLQAIDRVNALPEQSDKYQDRVFRGVDKQTGAKSQRAARRPRRAKFKPAPTGRRSHAEPYMAIVSAEA